MVFMYCAALPKIASLASEETLAYQIRAFSMSCLSIPMLTAFIVLTVSMMEIFFLNKHTIRSELLYLNECFLISNSWKLSWYLRTDKESKFYNCPSGEKYGQTIKS